MKEIYFFFVSPEWPCVADVCCHSDLDLKAPIFSCPLTLMFDVSLGLLMSFWPFTFSLHLPLIFSHPRQTKHCVQAIHSSVGSELERKERKRENGVFGRWRSYKEEGNVALPKAYGIQFFWKMGALCLLFSREYVCLWGMYKFCSFPLI